MLSVSFIECTKFVFGRGSASGPTGGAYSAPPDSMLVYGAVLLRGGEGSCGRRERPPLFRKFPESDPALCKT